jgi:hypothetical protein
LFYEILIFLKKKNINFLLYFNFLFFFYPNFLCYFNINNKKKSKKKINLENLLLVKEEINLSDLNYFSLYRNLKLEEFHSKTKIQQYKLDMDKEMFEIFKFKINYDTVSFDILEVIKIYLISYKKWAEKYLYEKSKSMMKIGENS